MNQDIENYRKDGFIDLNSYISDNLSVLTYPYYIDGYEDKNFWLKVKKEGEEKYVYVKPKENVYLNGEYNLYSELLYEELLKQAGVNTVHLDVGKYDGKYATLSENILKRLFI